MKKIVFIAMVVASSFALQGCFAALLGAGAGTTAKVATDPRTTGVQLDDNSLDSKIGIKFKDEAEYFKGTRIVASAYNGNILLIGQAQSEAQVAKALQIVESVEGVKQIYNQIRIGELIGPGTMTNDAWITTKVKTQLLSNGETKARDIKVITENSEVFLLGIVTRHEGKLAAELASKVDGVKYVTTIFTYLD